MTAPSTGLAAREPFHTAGLRLATAEIDDRHHVLVEGRRGLFRLDDLGLGSDGRSLLDLIETGWAETLDELELRLAADVTATPVEAVQRWLPPVPEARKLVCIGANYVDHITEMGLSADNRPPFPYSFAVPPSRTLVGTATDVTVPRIASCLDWEAEVAMVIGRTAHDVDVAAAMEHVAGFAVLNDLSARDWSGPNAPKVGIDWVMAKAYDGFKPMGPFLTPTRYVAEPDNLTIRSWVNDSLMQDGSTANMWFSFAEIIAHLSRIMTLEPGDLIATGTPAGVGHGRRPPRYLSPGDRVTVEVDGLGRVETTLVP